VNNLREILDSQKKEGCFVIARAPYGSPWQSQMRLASPTHSPTLWVGERDWLCQHILQPFGLENEIGFANTFSNPLGWRTRLALPTHSPTLWVGERDWLCQHILQPFGLENEIGFANTFSNPLGWRTRLFRRFAPRNLFFNGMYYNPSQNRRLPRLNTKGVQARNDKSIGCFVLRSSQ